MLSRNIVTRPLFNTLALRDGKQEPLRLSSERLSSDRGSWGCAQAMHVSVLLY